jgi:5-methyltetrahydrofolate--homocysteine methyltransferase
MLEEIRQALIIGDGDRTVALVNDALAAGTDPQVITDDALTAGMREVGELFDRGEYFIPEMLIAADAMEQAMEVLKPLLAADAGEGSGTVVIGTVQGDLHDIGKNLVITMLEGAGFRVIDLGVDVPATRFVDAVREHGPGVVGLGALLTTALARMGETIAALKELDPAPPVMVGGAAVTAEAGERLGADGYAGNAKQAVDLAAHLVAPR